MAQPVIKFADGNLGIILSSSDERKQEDIYHPTSPMLVAVNVNGDPEVGSLVFDLNEDSEYDGERWARLQSVFRVLKEPRGRANSIALQLGPSGQSDTDGGYYVDLGDGGNAEANEIAIGHGSYLNDGPFHVGHVNDKHNRGADGDDNPINCLHINSKFNLYKNKKEDGPLRIETYQKPDKDQKHLIPVHFGWDNAAQDWAWWTTSPLYSVPTPTPVPLPRGGDLPGNPNVPGVIEIPVRPGTPTLPTNPVTVGPISLQPTRIATDSRTGGVMNMVASLAAIVAPATLVRPQNYTDGQPNTGLFTDPNFGGFSDDEAINAAAQAKADQAPITGACSSFGAQGGTIAASGSVAADTTGAEGDPWVYTAVPRGRSESGKPTSKYLGGSANGGIVYHPPETDLRDVAAGMAPDNVTLSTMYILVAPGAYFGCGVPEMVNGTVKDGFSWGVDSATGDLVFRSHSASAAASEAMRFTKTAQDIQWRSGTAFNGILAHANTGDKTYTFQDASGTVAFLTDVGGITIGATVTGGTTGSILYVAAGPVLAQDNAGLFYDASNDRIGVGVASPQATFHGKTATHGGELQRLETTAPSGDNILQSMFQRRVATTDATQTILHAHTLTASKTTFLEFRVVARRTGGTAGTAEDGAAYIVRGTYKVVAGVATLIGSITTDYSAESVAGWDVTLDVSSATVRLQVTGAIDTNITWQSTETSVEVGS